MLPDLARESDLEARFLQEARAARPVESPRNRAGL